MSGGRKFTVMLKELWCDRWSIQWYIRMIYRRLLLLNNTICHICNLQPQHCFQLELQSKSDKGLLFLLSSLSSYISIFIKNSEATVWDRNVNHSLCCFQPLPSVLLQNKNEAKVCIQIFYDVHCTRFQTVGIEKFRLTLIITGCIGSGISFRCHFLIHSSII